MFGSHTTSCNRSGTSSENGGWKILGVSPKHLYTTSSDRVQAVYSEYTYYYQTCLTHKWDIFSTRCPLGGKNGRMIVIHLPHLVLYHFFSIAHRMKHLSNVFNRISFPAHTVLTPTSSWLRKSRGINYPFLISWC